jgi:hypothetical protein
MPCNTLAEVFQFEKWLDEAVANALALQGVLPSASINIQFSSGTESTPRIEVESIPGGVEKGRQSHLFADDTRMIFNTFDGRLAITVVTNREQKQQHRELCGAVRAALQPISLGIGWQGAPLNQAQKVVWQSEVVILTDIYLEGETQFTTDDAQNLDKSTIPFAILFNVLDSAWPTNL